MKRIIAIIVALASAFSLASCDRSYNENEIRAAAEELVKKAILLNEIFYGEGIHFDRDENTADGAYYEASSYYIQNVGIETVDDLKDMAREVFSEDYAELIFSTVLSPVTDNDYIYSMARYYQKNDALTGENIAIMVYSEATVYLTDKMEYDYSSVEVTGSKGERVYFNISVKVTDSETDEDHIMTRSVALVEEKGGWRIDSPTYVQYSKSLEEYEEIQNNK